MDNLDSQSAGSVGPAEDPPPPAITFQEQSTSESLGDSSGQRRPPPPLSPLTGCYLLIVIGEPHSERHKEIILQKIAKAFLSWDVNGCHVSLEKELQTLTEQSPQGEEARYGERLIQYATENLVTEILIHSQLNTLHQCMKNLLSSFTKHRHIIHAGYTFAGNGSWILQDGTLSISDLVEALHEPEVIRVLKAYENSVSIDIHCASEGDWTTERFQSESFSKLCNIRVNPGDIMTAGNPAISKFIEYLSPFLEPANIQELLQPTDVVGNIRFTHPTLYVFPGGQGDAALFGINGFNMLIDGGFARKACFWDFARHLDRLDAVLLTRLNNSTVSGISAVLQRKKMNHVYPQIGHFFCNLQDRKIALSPDGDKDKDSLIVNLAEEGQEIVANLRHLALKPHPCYRDGNQVDPVNLYHKVGHGKLDMYVISPARDSQAVKDFLAKWTSNDRQLFSNTGKKVGGKAFEFPLQNLVSICALLVWQPANPNDTITRILFPGSTPQHKIFEGLEKLRHLEFLKHPICSARSISPSASTIITSRSASKLKQPKTIVPDNKQKEAKTIIKSQVKPVKVKSEKVEKAYLKEIKSKIDTNKLIDEKKEIETAIEDPLKKLDNRIMSKDEQIENIKKEIHKIEQAGNEEHKKKIVHKSKYDMRNVKSKVDSRAPSKSVDRKKISDKKEESESSPPGTPKKSMANGVATKGEKAKIIAKVSASPLSTPAKSAKEANNRKVVEARVTTTLSNKSLIRKKEEPVNAKERKPIGRRPKGPTSPVKSAPTKPVKADAESLPKKIIKKPIIDSTIIKSVGQIITKKPIEDAEIKKTELDEQKVNKVEIQKVEAETTEIEETDAMAVKTEYLPTDSQDFKKNVEEEDDEDEEEDSDEGGEEEEEEYLIVTKEESTEDLVRDSENVRDYESYQEDMRTKDETEEEGEMKKLLREEEESEKKREPLEEVKGEQIIKDFNEQNSNTDKVKINQMMEEKEKSLEEKKELVEEKVSEKSEEKIPTAKEIEVQKVVDSDEGIEPGCKEHKEGESLPEEKVSNTVETSATTAPTLPEDEKLDEPLLEKEKSQPEDIREVVEEKYIQEETKEEKKPEIDEANLEQDILKNNVEAEEPPVAPPKTRKPRDVVKTPDEVADLPVHEEVDPRIYSSGLEFTKDFQKKTEEKIIPEEEISETKLDIKTADKGEANLLDEEEEPANESPCPETKEQVIEHQNVITSKYLNIIDELEKSASDSRRESPESEKDERQKKPYDPKRETDGSETSTLPLQKYAEVTKFIEEEKQQIQEPETKIVPKLTEEKPEIDLVEQEKESKTSQKIDTSKLKEDLHNLKPEDIDVTPQIPHDKLESSISKDISDGSIPQIISEKNIPTEISEKSDTTHPNEVEKSERSMPEDIVRNIPGKTSPQNLEERISRKNSLQQPDTTFETSELNKEILKQEVPATEKETLQNIEKLESASGKVSPQEQLKQVCKESSPVESDTQVLKDNVKDEVKKDEKDVSNLEKISPEKMVSESVQDKERKISQQLDEEKTKEILVSVYDSDKDISTKVPEELSEKVPSLEIIKPHSERSTPLDRDKDISGKSTPSEISKEVSKPGSPHDLDQVSGKTSPQVEEVAPKESKQSLSGKTSPLTEELKESKPSVSGKSSPQVEEVVIPEESKLSISRKSSSQIEESIRRESKPSISGKSSPQPGEVIPGESKLSISDKSLSQTEEPIRRESKPSISGKSSPVAEEVVPEESKPSISGKSSPQAEKVVPGESKPSILDKSLPQNEEVISVESKSDISGKSSPLAQEEVVLEESKLSISRKSSTKTEEPIHTESKLSISGKSSPQPQEEVVPEESKLTISRKSSSQSEEPIRRESKPSISGKTSPSLGEPIRRKSKPNISGKSSPQPEEIILDEANASISRKSSTKTEEPIHTESKLSISGKSSPQPQEEVVPEESKLTISRKSSSQSEEPIRRESKPSISGKSSPQPQEEIVPEESKLSISRKSSSQTEEAVRRESKPSISGKTSPSLGEPIRRESKPSISGKTSPQEQEEIVPEESKPSISRKSSTKTEEPIHPDSKLSISGKTSPSMGESIRRESKPSFSGKSSPQPKEVMPGESIPHESKPSISDKSLLQTEEPIRRESKPSISGKTSPQEQEEVVPEESKPSISRKSSTKTEEPIHPDSKLSISGKTSPSMGESIRRESKPSISGKSSPQPKEVMPGESIPHESKPSISDKSLLQTEEPIRRESKPSISGKTSPEGEKVIPEESKPSISVISSRQEEVVTSVESKQSRLGKSSPQTEEPIRRESKPSISEKSSPQTVELICEESKISISDKSLLQTKEAVLPESKPNISGKSSPQDLESNVSELVVTLSTESKGSGKSTPIELKKNLVDENAIQESEKDLSGKSTPQSYEKKSYGKITPLDDDQKASGKSTPHDFSADKHILEQSISPEKRVSTENLLSENLSHEKDKEIPQKISDDKIENDEIIGEEKILEETTSVDISHLPEKETSSKSSPRGSVLEEVSKSDSPILIKSDQVSDSTTHVVVEKKTQDIPTVDSEKNNIESSESVISSSITITKAEIQDAVLEFKSKISTESTDKISDSDIEKSRSPVKEETPEPIIQQDMPAEEMAGKSGRVDSLVSNSISPENNVSGRSTPSSLNKKTFGKSSPALGEKLTSDSVSTALAEKGTSATYSLERESCEKSSSLSPVDISPISMDKIKELGEDISKEKLVSDDEKETDSAKSIGHQKEGGKPIAEHLYRNPLESLKYEGESSGTSSPEKSHRETSDISVTNGIESEEELEKGTLESERQEKESQILDISSGEEEELKGLGVDDEDGDSDQELRREKDNIEEENIILISGSRAEIAKGEKDDLNKLVKIGSVGKDTEEDLSLDKQKGVKRMLVTASSEDGGTETEISLQGGAKSAKDTEEGTEKDVLSNEEEFKNLIIQAKKEYITQRLRKTSCNSVESEGNEKDEVEDLESVVGESENEKEEELSTLLMQARQELAFVRSKSRESQISSETEKINTKTTTTSETTQISDNDIITITTILTEERMEQEDGSIKLTTTKETKTKGGKDEGTVVIVNTKIEKRPEEKESRNGFSSLPGESKNVEKVRKGSLTEAELSRAEAAGDSRRSSVSSITSQREIVFRTDPGKLEEIRHTSTEIGPLKTTYITSHGDSESLMTSSFYGDMPSQEELIKRSEHSGEFRKGRGYESFTEINTSGERTERTYLYRAEEEPIRVGRDGTRFVRAFYTEERQPDPKRLVYRHYTSEIPEEVTEEKMELERQYFEEEMPTELRKKYRFVECSSPELTTEHIEFSKAIDEHVSTRGECLGKEIRQDITMYRNGKEKPTESEGAIEEEEEEEIEEVSGLQEDNNQKMNKKDVIENWGKPLGLPLPPKNINKTYSFPGQNISTTSSLSTPTDNSDSITNWGQPMSLPSPAPPFAPNGVAENLIGKMVNGAKDTPKKEKKIQMKKADAKGSGSNTPNRRSESPVKQMERRTPSTGRTNRSTSNSYLYLDLTYVPHHGNSYYSNVEFFKKVRARYYVFSGTEPSKEVYNALLEAKQTWEDKKLEVTIIPTYDTDVLGYWVAENEEILAKNKIDLSPSASRCTINLQDHETSCSAYRLEF